MVILVYLIGAQVEKVEDGVLVSPTTQAQDRHHLSLLLIVPSSLSLASLGAMWPHLGQQAEDSLLVWLSALSRSQETWVYPGSNLVSKIPRPAFSFTALDSISCAPWECRLTLVQAQTGLGSPTPHPVSKSTYLLVAAAPLKTLRIELCWGQVNCKRRSQQKIARLPSPLPSPLRPYTWP